MCVACFNFRESIISANVEDVEVIDKREVGVMHCFVFYFFIIWTKKVKLHPINSDN